MDKINSLIRAFLVLFCFAFFGAGGLVISYIIFPLQKAFGKKDVDLRLRYGETLQKSWRFFVNMLLALKIIKIKSTDLERLKNIKNSIIVSTHPSYIDILILISIIPRSTCFVAEKLMRNPFFKRIVSRIFIPEGTPAQEWTKEACEMFELGFNLIIFPMGTRHKKGEYPKIRRGAALIAQKARKNIVMLDMETSFDFLQIHEPVYKAGVEPVEYTISYLGELNTAQLMEKYPDEVTFKTEVTKLIAKNLYHDKN